MDVRVDGILANTNILPSLARAIIQFQLSAELGINLFYPARKPAILPHIQTSMKETE